MCYMPFRQLPLLSQAQLEFFFNENDPFLLSPSPSFSHPDFLLSRDEQVFFRIFSPVTLRESCRSLSFLTILGFFELSRDSNAIFGIYNYRSFFLHIVPCYDVLESFLFGLAGFVPPTRVRFLMEYFTFPLSVKYLFVDGCPESSQ